MDNGKQFGKIIIRNRNEFKSFFSPACCFTKGDKTTYIPIKVGENICKCPKCGRTYRVTVNGIITDFENIVREEILPELPKEVRI